MTYETIMYGIKCNRCQKIYEDSEGANLAVDRHGDLEESAQEDGWHVNGDRHYCPNCYTINENDEVVTKPLIDYYFDYRTPEKIKGKRYETETIRIPKDFKHK